MNQEIQETEKEDLVQILETENDQREYALKVTSNGYIYIWASYIYSFFLTLIFNQRFQTDKYIMRMTNFLKL